MVLKIFTTIKKTLFTVLVFIFLYSMVVVQSCSNSIENPEIIESEIVGLWLIKSQFKYENVIADSTEEIIFLSQNGDSSITLTFFEDGHVSYTSNNEDTTIYGTWDYQNDSLQVALLDTAKVEFLEQTLWDFEKGKITWSKWYVYPHYDYFTMTYQLDKYWNVDKFIKSRK